MEEFLLGVVVCAVGARLLARSRSKIVPMAPFAAWLNKRGIEKYRKKAATQGFADLFDEEWESAGASFIPPELLIGTESMRAYYRAKSRHYAATRSF